MATAADSAAVLVAGGFPGLGAKIGIVEVTIDLAVVSAELVAQGDGELATGDIIQAISIPAGTVVLAAGIQVMTAIAGATALDADMGITGGDVDIWMDGIDLATLAANAYASTPAALNGGVVFTAADTIDILCNTVTGSLTAGVLRVFAVVANCAAL